jgi:hypothetical protein
VTEAAPPVAELLNLGGRVALMTGASSGVGAGIARRVVEAGAAVVVHYRSDADGAAAVVDAIGGREAVRSRHVRIFMPELLSKKTLSVQNDVIRIVLGFERSPTNAAERDLPLTSDGATYHFCPECGSTVYWDMAVAPDIIGVAVGGFTDPTFPPPMISGFEGYGHPWAMNASDLPMPGGAS